MAFLRMVAPNANRREKVDLSTAVSRSGIGAGHQSRALVPLCFASAVQDGIVTAEEEKHLAWIQEWAG